MIAKEDKIILEIKDNGKGFDFNKTEEGLGLKLIKDFSKKLNNSNFNYILDNGTVFVLTFNNGKENNES